MQKNKKSQHLSLLMDFGEMLAVLAGSSDVPAFLDKTVNLVADYLEADVCSIYLYQESSDELVLRATRGLNKESVNQIRMKNGEGIVGAALKEMRPIFEKDANQNPHFKLFKEAGEEAFPVFLAVPILRGLEKIGVLVVQRRDKNYFNEEEITAVRILNSQLAGSIENARTLLNMASKQIKQSDSGDVGLIKGQSVSPGTAIGPATIYALALDISLFAEKQADKLNHLSQKDFDKALEKTKKQISHFQKELEHRLPEAVSFIFGAHLMMLNDDAFTGEMRKKMEAGATIVDAVISVARQFIEIFENSPHDYIKEKVHDVSDLALRILNNLLEEEESLDLDSRGSIVIVRNLLPSNILKLALENVKGIVLTSGGAVSHVAILARSLGIPMIIASHNGLYKIKEGTKLILDAHVGNIFIDPDDNIIQTYKQRDSLEDTVASSAKEIREYSECLDGTKIKLLANINLLSELDLAQTLKAEGIGLYRTEFPFLVRRSLPTMEEQNIVYSKLIKAMPDKEITFRTLDVGGDKLLGYFDEAAEVNPELGLRSLRFLFKYQDILEKQVEAILRAAADKKIRIMFPLVSSPEELIKAKEITLEIWKKLRGNDLNIAKPALGMMIEMPAVVPLMEEFCALADFFSVGTNDFIQYTLAVDRGNPNVAEYYRPEHPAVLRSLATVIKIAVKHKKDISICGEMAHDIRFLPFFIGLGIRKLSLDPHFFPLVQKKINQIDPNKASKTAEKLVKAVSIQEVSDILRQ